MPHLYQLQYLSLYYIEILKVFSIVEYYIVGLVTMNVSLLVVNKNWALCWGETGAGHIAEQDRCKREIARERKGGREVKRAREREKERERGKERECGVGATEVGELAGECCRHQSAWMQTPVCEFVCKSVCACVWASDDLPLWPHAHKAGCCWTWSPVRSYPRWQTTLGLRLPSRFWLHFSCCCCCCAHLNVSCT